MLIRCPKCDEYKGSINFYKCKTRRNGYRPYCKSCSKKDKKLYEYNNKEKISKYREKYKNENPEYFSNYYLENKEKILNRSNENYLKNKEKKLKYYKKYRKENKERINEYRRNKYRKDTHISSWRTLLRNTLKRLNKPKEGKTIDILGYSALELKNYISKLFTEGMNWDNYGEWHIDHIKPVISFNENTPVSVVCALSNLQPLWSTTREINGVVYIGNTNKGSKYL